MKPVWRICSAVVLLVWSLPLPVFLGTLCAASVQPLAIPILLNCGSSSSITVDGRKWIGDSTLGENFTLSSPGVASPASRVDGEPIYRNLYQNARIFNTSTSYKFTILPGNYYVRFHFFPFSFASFNANESLFEVLANNLKLLSKFNVPSEIDWKNKRSNSNTTSLVKEYYLKIGDLNELKIEFVPEFGSFAFINALEVILVLDELFTEEQGIETMYRLNVGGPEIESSKDQGLWRNWVSDESFMFSVNAAYSITNTSNVSFAAINDTSSAPLQVYETARTMTDNQVAEKRFNVSWKFDVDPNFEYLIRLHFCELVFNKPNQRIFRIFVNNKTKAENYDIFARAGGKNKAYHEDYIEEISPKVDTLWLQLGTDSSTSVSGTDALLNGVEIFKLSRNGVLAHAHERFSTVMTEGIPVQKPKSKILWAIIGAGVGLAVAVGSLLCAVFYYNRFLRKKPTPSAKTSPVWRLLSLHGTVGSTTNATIMKSPTIRNGSTTRVRGRRFTVAEMRAATRNFVESLVIGTGGFGKVYKGELDEGLTVAIKRANPQSKQGVKEFETEIEVLSKLRHRHLVAMIGYCDEQGEMILVYEYMSNGTLRSHLFGSDFPPLTWRQRLDACVGAARGLHYLHTGAQGDGGIIHRDVKTTNILLDENFVAKVADFGLSKDGPAFDRTHVSTAVKGSFGYLDPEYFRRQQLTEKSDVYSFGVVLFEVICARPVIDPSRPREEINLAEWALGWQRRAALGQIVDGRLEGEYLREEMDKVGEIAGKCLADEGRYRPTMGEVLWHLERVVQMHEAHVQRRRDADVSCTLPRILEGAEEAKG